MFSNRRDVEYFNDCSFIAFRIMSLTQMRLWYGDWAISGVPKEDHMSAYVKATFVGDEAISSEDKRLVSSS